MNIGLSNIQSPLAAAARATAARLRAWLLQGPAQLRDGAQAGGVAGLIDAHDNPRYVYAEITGYYLSWLADVAGGPDDTLVRERARLAIDWATRAFAHAGQAPQTRIYLGAAEADWRNDAVFVFDLAMLLRGLDAAEEAGIARPGELLRATLHEQLSHFVRDDTLQAAIQLRGATALPARWSTLGGPFLVKASSRISLGGRHRALPPALAHACAATSARWAPDAGLLDIGMLHPTLYFAEGLLIAHPEHAGGVAGLLRRCLDLAYDDGSLPETEGGRRARNDILAQALRVGLLLRESHPADAPEPAAIERLADTLLRRIGGRDFLAFNADTAEQANVWATMFAEQALRWFALDPAAAHRRPVATALV